MQDIGRMLILFGGVLAVIGGLILLLGRVPGLGLGRLPGRHCDSAARLFVFHSDRDVDHPEHYAYDRPELVAARFNR